MCARHIAALLILELCVAALELSVAAPRIRRIKHKLKVLKAAFAIDNTITAAFLCDLVPDRVYCSFPPISPDSNIQSDALGYNLFS